MNDRERILKIAKNVIADIVLRDENELNKYIKDHPDYREDTVFVVNGIARKAPPKQNQEKK